ncbi:hypothetical protein U1Q18_004926 [Sarracenia purpurea var. burkii]
MASRFQAAALVASPSYPNAIAWSDENLVAVASGHLVTILNPATPFGPRGLITILPSKPFPIGVIERKDLLSGCLLPTCLSRDLRPCVRSISWSPIGFAQNSGCLLAVCTTEGRVKLYRMPYRASESTRFRSWMYCDKDSGDLGDRYLPSRNCEDTYPSSVSCTRKLITASKEVTFFPSTLLQEGSSVEVLRLHGHQRIWIEGILDCLNGAKAHVVFPETDGNGNGSVTLDAGCVRLAPLWINEQNSWQVTLVKIEMKDQELCKVLEIKPDNMKANNLNQLVFLPNSKAKPLKKIPERSSHPLITVDQYASHSAMLSSLVVAWSPVVPLMSEIDLVSANYLSIRCSILAVGGKSGKISFWRILEPQCFSVTSNRDSTAVFLVGLLQAHGAWITAIGWALFASDASDPRLLLATGSSDGSVKIWLAFSGALLKSSEVNHTPFSLLKEVITVDSVPVSIVSLIVPIQSPPKMHLAVGKGSGSFDVLICDISTTASRFEKFSSYDAHEHIDALVLCLLYLLPSRQPEAQFGCSYPDNSVHSWILHDYVLHEVPFPSNTPGVKSFHDVPNVFDSSFGLAVSPGNLVVAVV